MDIEYIHVPRSYPPKRGLVMGNHGIICYLAVVKFPALLHIDLVGMYSNESIRTFSVSLAIAHPREGL